MQTADERRLINYIHGTLSAEASSALETELATNDVLRTRLATLRQEQRQLERVVTHAIQAQQPSNALQFDAIAPKLARRQPNRRINVLSTLSGIAAVVVLFIALVYSLPDNMNAGSLPIEGSGVTQPAESMTESLLVEPVVSLTPTSTATREIVVTPGEGSIPRRPTATVNLTGTVRSTATVEAQPGTTTIPRRTAEPESP